MPAYLAETCHLHLWQNDLDLLYATGVVEQIPKWSPHRKLTLEKKKFSRCFCQDLNLESISLPLSHPHSPFFKAMHQRHAKHRHMIW